MRKKIAIRRRELLAMTRAELERITGHRPGMVKRELVEVALVKEGYKKTTAPPLKEAVKHKRSVYTFQV